METQTTAVEMKVCRRCERELELDKFRTRPSGFTLNQCRECESALGKARREAKKGNVTMVVSQNITVTTKSGKSVNASLTPIPNGRKASSPLTEKVLYFDSTVNRDTARVAFSAYANVSRTGITYQPV
jgi:NMD protein affecting ribosome stability and mRNA decay